MHESTRRGWFSNGIFRTILAGMVWGGITLSMVLCMTPHAAAQGAVADPASSVEATAATMPSDAEAPDAMELIARMIEIPYVASVSGRSTSMAESLVGVRDAAGTVRVVRAYWRVSESICTLRTLAEHAERLRRFQPSGIDDLPQLETYRDQSDRRVRLAAAVLQRDQRDLAEAMRGASSAAGRRNSGGARVSDAAESLPLPSDLPLTGGYETLYERFLRASRNTLDPRARLIDQLLPLERLVIESRVAQVVAAEFVFLDAIDACTAGLISLDDFLCVADESLRGREEFIAAVFRYNHEIADYIFLVAPEMVGPAIVPRLVREKSPSAMNELGWKDGPASPGLPNSPDVTMVHTVAWVGADDGRTTATDRVDLKNGGGSKSGEGSEVPGWLNAPQERSVAADGAESVFEIGSGEWGGGSFGGFRDANGEPLQPTAMQETSEPPPLGGSGASGFLSEGAGANGSGSGDLPSDGPGGSPLTDVSEVETGIPQPGIPDETIPVVRRGTPLPVETPTTAAPAALPDTASVVPPPPSDVQFYPTLGAMTPALRTKGLATALHVTTAVPVPTGVTGHPVPMTLVQVIERAGAGVGVKRSVTHASWEVATNMARYRVRWTEQAWIEAIAEQLTQRLAVVADDPEQVTGFAAVMLRLNLARHMAVAETAEATVSLWNAQFRLARLLGLPDATAWPVVTTIPHNGPFEMHADRQPESVVGDSVGKRLVELIPGRYAYLVSLGEAVVRADAARADAMVAATRDPKMVARALVTIRDQVSTSETFLEALVGYNRAIADYAALTYTTSVTTEQWVKTLVVTP